LFFYRYFADYLINIASSMNHVNIDSFAQKFGIFTRSAMSVIIKKSLSVPHFLVLGVRG